MRGQGSRQDFTAALLDRYQAKRAVRPVAEKAEIDPRRRAYREAAAVLHRFSADALQPHGGRRKGENPRLILFADIERVTTATGEHLFHLKSDIRRETLASLRTRDKMSKQLAANSARITTPLQQMWEAYLQSGKLPELQKLRYAELTNVSQIVEWMDGLDDSLPRLADVLALARRRSVFASFEHLVDSSFTGRTKELQQLLEYIGALDKTPTGPEAIYQQLKNWIGGKTKPALAISGPGGIGKTALIGRLLLDHAEADRQARIPFAYLAFDQPTLRIETPFTILVEAASQFELQWPEHADAIESFRQSVRSARQERSDIGDHVRIATSRRSRIGRVGQLDEDIYRSFARMLETIARRTVNGRAIEIPVLVVLDTFEEVQYRDRESLAGFWRMLAAIQQHYKSFRVLISGRSAIDPVRGFKINKLVLTELEKPDRLTLLRRLGVKDTKLAQAVADQVGGNPLSLRLAASLILSHPESGGAGGITDLSTKRWLVFQASEELIQGQLYQRILAHIHDENVAKLAHPGMVLRRVTPEVILHVLAPVLLPSLTELTDSEQTAEASRLFEELKRESSLVESGMDGALVYRQEIRRAMVRLLEQDRRGEVRTLRRAAIAYYSHQKSIEARAEELYHRILLGEDDFSYLESRWRKGIEQAIAAGVEEYSPRVQAWLASWMELEVPRGVFKSADVEEWERNITRKVQRALSYQGTEEALSLLHERSARTVASPLFALETKTYMLLDDWDNASKVLQQGIARVSESTNRGRLAELFWLQSQVLLLRNEPPSAADQALSRAEKTIEGASNPVPLVHVLGQRLLLRKTVANATYEETSVALRQRLDRACQRIDANVAYADEVVIRLAVDMLEKEYPQTSERLRELTVESMGFLESLGAYGGDPLTSENLRGLDEYREAWEREAEPSAEAAV
jgi:hypothetical protein